MHPVGKSQQTVLQSMMKWIDKPSSNIFVLIGGIGVGKTSVINMFSKLTKRRIIFMSTVRDVPYISNSLNYKHTIRVADNSVSTKWKNIPPPQEPVIFVLNTFEELSKLKRNLRDKIELITGVLYKLSIYDVKKLFPSFKDFSKYTGDLNQIKLASHRIITKFDMNSMSTEECRHHFDFTNHTIEDCVDSTNLLSDMDIGDNVVMEIETLYRKRTLSSSCKKCGHPMVSRRQKKSPYKFFMTCSQCSDGFNWISPKTKDTMIKQLSFNKFFGKQYREMESHARSHLNKDKRISVVIRKTTRWPYTNRIVPYV